ncbi:MAG: hypothetical protein IKE65_00745 [Clostridia bacterium]|nr:hypothetical protein [Clostridia bacterium]
MKYPSDMKYWQSQYEGVLRHCVPQDERKVEIFHIFVGCDAHIAPFTIATRSVATFNSEFRTPHSELLAYALRKSA